MDKSKYTDNSPGELVTIHSPTRPNRCDWSFIPDALPPKWEFDPSLWPLLVEANGKLEKLDGIGQTLPNPELLVRPLQEREAIASSRIEGTRVTPQQLMLYMVDQKDKNATRNDISDWAEVFNYSRALREGHNMSQRMPFCDDIYQSMHAMLLSQTRNAELSPGEYRKVQVEIGHSGRFVPPPPSEIDRLLSNFNKFVNSEDRKWHPLICAFIAHYQFESIHPFRDGNGRIGRALLSVMVSRWLGHSMPWLYLSAFFEKYKSEYIEGLFRVGTHGAWTEWIEFCLNGTIRQAEDAIRRCHAFDKAKKQFHSLVSDAKRTYNLIEGLFTTPVITISSVMKSQSVTYDTARKDIERLLDVSIVREMENIYPRTFICDRIMAIAFQEEFSEEAIEDRTNSAYGPFEMEAAMT